MVNNFVEARVEFMIDLPGRMLHETAILLRIEIEVRAFRVFWPFKIGVHLTILD